MTIGTMTKEISCPICKAKGSDQECVATPYQPYSSANLKRLECPVCGNNFYRLKEVPNDNSS